jgi:outer membrane immunogenic protein
LVAGTSKSKFKVGYTVGGGVEYGVTPNWTVKAEYMYADFGSITHVATSALGTQPGFKHDLDVHTAKIGIAYKF